MNKLLIREVLGPAIARVGTAISGYLVGAGAASSDAEKIAVGAIALVMVGADLALGHFFRKVTK